MGSVPKETGSRIFISASFIIISNGKQVVSICGEKNEYLAYGVLREKNINRKLIK